MPRERYIRVPKNKKAIENYNYGIQKQEQMEEMILSEEQYRMLEDIGIFEIINEKCDTIIDDYEEEILELHKIPMAKNNHRKMQVKTNGTI